MGSVTSDSHAVDAAWNIESPSLGGLIYLCGLVSSNCGQKVQFPSDNIMDSLFGNLHNLLHRHLCTNGIIVIAVPSFSVYNIVENTLSLLLTLDSMEKAFVLNVFSPG